VRCRILHTIKMLIDRKIRKSLSKKININNQNIVLILYLLLLSFACMNKLKRVK